MNNNWLLGVVGVLSLGTLLTTVYMTNELESTLTKQIGEAKSDIESNLYKSFKSNKPDSYQEIIVKSDRILNHTKYLADKYFSGNILAPKLAQYASKAFDEVMLNTYNNLFYAKLDAAGIEQSTIQLYKKSGEGKVFSENVTLADGALIRDKYYLDISNGSMFGDLVKEGSISTTYLYMVNDLIVYPKCAVAESPVIIFGELYPEDSEILGAELIPEARGWRVTYADAGPLSSQALKNRLIHQTACRSLTSPPAKQRLGQR